MADNDLVMQAVRTSWDVLPLTQFTWGPFYYHRLTLIPVWISNHMPTKIWDEITYSFPNFNGITAELGNGSVYVWNYLSIPKLQWYS